MSDVFNLKQGQTYSFDQAALIMFLDKICFPDWEAQYLTRYYGVPDVHFGLVVLSTMICSICRGVR